MSQETSIAFKSLEALEAFLEQMIHTPSDEAEGLSEMDHGLQCAAVLKAECPDDLVLQVAGLLHDVGHTFSHIRDHGEAGGLALRELMGDRIADLVSLHVPAKRYLVTTDPAYRALLSPRSIETLALQGGDMSPAEVAAYEGHPHGADAVRLRRADEQAKVIGLDVPGLDAWREAIKRTARS